MNKDTPLFSVCVIAKNEAKTLPRLAESLKEFLARGGDWVVVDTGSTDDTKEVAKKLGARVFGADSSRRLSCDEADNINAQFIIPPDKHIVASGDRFFHFSAARNFAASRCKHDMVAMPDCDEQYTRLDIDAINEAIKEGVQQFEYNFVFAHDAQGKPLVQFRHCKFYNRAALKWVRVVHEVLTPLEDAPKHTPCCVNYIQLEHWQNPDTNRRQYLTGLAVDCLENPDGDRNLHYFARELMWAGRYRSAIKVFSQHVNLGRWPAEAAQSIVFIGDCWAKLGQPETARANYFLAWEKDGGRREPLMRLADYYYQKKDAPRAAAMAEAALTIPLNDYYGNNMVDYTWYPHEILYWAHWQLGNKAVSRHHWELARSHAPLNSKYLHDARFYHDLPKVSIVIPHVEGTRENELTLLQSLIKANANYPNYEVIVELDTDQSGCPVTFNRGVKRASGSLIMYLGDDCEPCPDFLIQAVLSHLKYFNGSLGVTALNDEVWNGQLATHFLADRYFSESYVPGQNFFCEWFHHVGCDNFLTAVAKNLKRYNYAVLSKIIHHTPYDSVRSKAWDPERVEVDRIKLNALCDQYDLSKEAAVCPGHS